MKKISITIIIGLLLAFSAGHCLAQNGHDLFQKALVKERTEGDLEAAIALHERIVKECADDRPLAAKALLHLGQCYEKLGKDEARNAYEQLVADYADQASEVAEARTRLAALAKPPGDESAFVAREVWLEADGVFEGAPSPDGRYMSYVDWETGNLAIRDLQTGTNRVITKDGSWEKPNQYVEASQWSPDGKQLAYAWYVDGSGYELRVVTLDDPKPQILFREETDARWLALEDWSPDGRLILVKFSREPATQQLALIPVEGGSPRVLKNFEQGVVSSGVARFSPDGRYVVYDRTPGKVAALDLFVLDVRNGSETPLVHHPADDCVFGWSPDGNWVLFLSDRSGTLDLWAARVADGKPKGAPVKVKLSIGRVAPLGFTRDGSFYYCDVKVARDVYAAKIDFQKGEVLEPPKKAIVKHEGSNMNPRYSPDGKSLAYISRRGSMVIPTARGNALCVHSFETGVERFFMDEFVQLGVRTIAGPRWSPNGRSIVVAGLWVVGARSGLYLVRLDTGEVKPLVELPAGVRVRNHEWAREEQGLFYLREDNNQKLSQILEINVQSGQERELFRCALDDGPVGIALSSDGKWLALRNGPVLSVMPSGGGTPHEIHRFEQGRYTTPEWMPDGRSVLIGGRIMRNGQANGILYRVPVEGGHLQEIVVEKRFWDRPSIHPDGQQIAFSSISNRDSDADVWVMENFLPELASAK